MRFNPEDGISAKDLLASMQQSEIEHIIKFYGEEKQYKSIAKNIYDKILKNNMNTTFDLKDAIEDVVSKRYI